MVLSWPSRKAKQNRSYLTMNNLFHWFSLEDQCLHCCIPGNCGSEYYARLSNHQRVFQVLTMMFQSPAISVVDYEDNMTVVSSCWNRNRWTYRKAQKHAWIRNPVKTDSSSICLISALKFSWLTLRVLAFKGLSSRSSSSSSCEASKLDFFVFREKRR